MSRATVRAATVAWFAPPNVAGLYTVYKAQPKLIPNTAYRAGAPAGTASGAIMFPHIEEETEHRIAFGGATSGHKLIEYKLGLVVRFLSVRTKSEDAQDDYDALIEAVKQRIRQDRTWGTSASANPIFEAGDRGPGIHLISDLPRQNKNGATLIWSALTVSMFEVITA